MIVYGNKQNVVGLEMSGDINKTTFELPPEIVKVGNSMSILVRPTSGVCWSINIEYDSDTAQTKEATEMTKSGIDSNTMKVEINDNVVSFEYQNSDGANVENDSTIAIVYHRNFN